MRATVVKRAYGPSPVTSVRCRAGLTVLVDLPRSCPGLPVARQGSSWSARSRAAARMNELDAGERREIIGEREGSLCGFGLCGGRVLVSRCLAGGVISQAPIRHLRAGGAMP
jgi:hypothetical protein